jgi:hypothetical protein
MSEVQRVAALKKLVAFKTHCVRAFKVILDKGRGTVHTMKFHVQCHFLDYIMHLGLPAEFCVQEAEHAHVDLKATAELTNNRHESFTRQMLNVIDRENAMERYAPRAASLRVHPSHEGDGNNLVFRRVMAKTRTRFSLMYDDLSETGLSSLEKGQLCSILEGFLQRSRKVQVGSTIRVFKTMDIPVASEYIEFGGPARVDTIRADPSYHNAPWFSDVSIKSGRNRGDVWYAQVRLMFMLKFARLLRLRLDLHGALGPAELILCLLLFAGLMVPTLSQMKPHAHASCGATLTSSTPRAFGKWSILCLTLIAMMVLFT